VSKPIPEKGVKQIFKQFGLLFGKGFTSQFEKPEQRQEAKLIWGKALTGIPLDMIALAFRKLEQSGKSFPPNIPEFVALCKPTAQDMGLPDADESYQVIINGLHLRQAVNQPLVDHLRRKYQHPFHRVVASHCDRMNLNLMRPKEAVEHVRKAHNKALKSVFKEPRLLQWPVAGIEKTKPSPAQKPTMSRADAMAQMREALG